MSGNANGTSHQTATLPRFDVSIPPSQPSLHAKHQSLSDVLDPKYWQQLNPGLRVGNAGFISSCKPLKPPKDRLKDLCQQINTAGVAQVEPQELPWKLDLEALADAVVNLVRHGWPPSMLVVYDEVWALVHQASAVMKAATGGNMCNMDILAWLVDPNRGDVGFSPHRDRQPDDSPATFRPDGSAMYATMWVPLTHATPDNSCLYVIPRFADPGYHEGDPEDEGAPDPMTAALPNKEAYQNIRALPAQPGAAVLFTHRTIHWGSKGRPGYPYPRISISWGCADDAYEPAYFSREHLPCPPLALRLGLVGAQMIIYHERFPAPVRQLRLYYEAFTAQSAQFDPTYRAKVVREFVDASKEATATAAAAANGAAPRGAAGVVVGSKEAAAAEAAVPAVSGAAAKGTAAVAKKGSRVAVGSAGSSGAKEKKVNKAEAIQQAANGAAVADGIQLKQKQKQKLKQDKVSKKRNKDAAAATIPPTAAAAAGKKSKRQKQQHDPVAAAIAAAGAAKQPSATAAAAVAADSTDDEDEGVGIDWALLAAQAKAHQAKAKSSKQSSKTGSSAKGKGSSSAAAAGGCDGMSDDDDVMDLALEAMLDGDGDFADDYEDE